MGKCSYFKTEQNKMLDQVQSGIEKLRALSDNADQEEKERLIGELLLSVSGLSSSYDVDAEQSLYNACDDFINRFASFEAEAASQDIKIQELPETKAGQLWKNSK